MKSLVVIMAHERGQAVFDMNLPLWESHGAEILVVGSEPDPVQTKYRSVLAGDNLRGPRCYARWLAMIRACREAAESGVEMFMFYEYDSVCTSPHIPMKKGMFGIVQYQQSPDNWMAVRYANLPWRIDADSVVAIHDKLLEYPEFQENGCNDRLIPAAASLCGIPLMPFTPFGYGAPGGMVHDNMLVDLQEAVDRGAFAFHGIKTQKAHDIVTGHARAH